jgi:ABC-type tungstate transport system permease subunit
LRDIQIQLDEIHGRVRKLNAITSHQPAAQLEDFQTRCDSFAALLEEGARFESAIDPEGEMQREILAWATNLESDLSSSIVFKRARSLAISLAKLIEAIMEHDADLSPVLTFKSHGELLAALRN